MPPMQEPAPLVLTPIGVGTAYSRPGDVQSCYLVQAHDSSVVLDMGAGSLNRLQQVIAPEDLDAVVISHGHPDHCIDLLALRVYSGYGPGRGAEVVVHAPEGVRERLFGFLGDSSWPGIRFVNLESGEGSVELASGVTLTHREVPHLPPTHALRIDAGGRSIVYSADTGTADAVLPLAAGCDLLLCESSFGADSMPDEPALHLNAAAAGDLARRAKAGRLLLTHCYPEHDLEEARRAAAATFGGEVAIARQGEAVSA
jgi:ribonuclease BN (tRNA processing enzyme)